MPNSEIESPLSRLGAERRLDASRLVRAMAFVSILGGALTVLSIAVPHMHHTFDAHFLAIGGALFIGGAFLLLWSRSREVSVGTVHVSTFLLSVAALLLAWFGMRDVGGVQAVFLILLLGISASLGPGWWAVLFLVLQSAGYALVLMLAAAETPSGFDAPAQWMVVTMGLVVCVAYNGMIRRALAEHAVREQERRSERDRERELHAERLERLNEELQHASELKSSFVAMASHELRTPLTAIEGFATTLQHRWADLEDADKRAFVEVIDAQAQRLGRLVGDLLTLSRIESGRLVSHPADVPVRDTVERTIRELGEIEVDIDCDPDLRVRVDADHLQQILLNFFSNARAYGAQPVTFRARRDGNWVELEVADEGPGVEPSFVPQLFDRFARAPVTERHDGSSGTGLGLSIVEGLAEANGGRAWYRPNEPAGARFGVRLPVAQG